MRRFTLSVLALLLVGSMASAQHHTFYRSSFGYGNSIRFSSLYTPFVPSTIVYAQPIIAAPVIAAPIVYQPVVAAPVITQSYVAPVQAVQAVSTCAQSVSAIGSYAASSYGGYGALGVSAGYGNFFRDSFRGSRFGPSRVVVRVRR